MTRIAGEAIVNPIQTPWAGDHRDTIGLCEAKPDVSVLLVRIDQAETHTFT
jgi:hypothetical protein